MPSAFFCSGNRIHCVLTCVVFVARAEAAGRGQRILKRMQRRTRPVCVQRSDQDRCPERPMGVEGSRSHRMERRAGSTMSQKEWTKLDGVCLPSAFLIETPFRIETDVSVRKQTTAPLSNRNSPRRVSAIRKSLLFLRLVLKCPWKSRIDCAALWYYRAACVPSGIGSRPSPRSRRDKTHSLSR